MAIETNQFEYSLSSRKRTSVVDMLWSLQFKATGLVVVFSVALVAAASWFLVGSSVLLLRQQRDETLVQLAETLSRLGSAKLAEGDRASLMGLARDEANGAPLAYVQFTDPVGNELALQYHRSAGTCVSMLKHGPTRSELGSPTLRRGTQDGPIFVDIVYPVNLESGERTATGGPSTVLIGYLRAGIVAESWQKLLASRLDMMVGVSVIVAVLAVPLGFLVIRRIVSPLDELANAMGCFSRGDLSVRSSTDRRDEIGRLASAFNRMADEHQQTHERLVKTNADLENRVAQRTKQLRELAVRDPLTGLHNRRHFNEVLDRAFAEAGRYRHDLTCIMVDLDDFKAVNDNFGHHTGDELLVLMATTILEQLRTSDISARYGGDEFIILLPKTDSARARVLAERIMERFQSEALRKLPKVGASVSLGIACLSQSESATPAALVQAADRVLYEAKKAGKACVFSIEQVPA